MGTLSAAPSMQAKENSAGGDGFSKPGCLKPSNGMRRSCDACGRKKRKCDRGRPACGRCQRVGQECVYSKRIWHLPVPQQDSTSGAVLGHGGIQPFKRCRLSASPATGLVGMQENAFLSEFFGCVGFLPLTTQSHIRETMVKIMLAPASRQQEAFGTDGRETGQPNAVEVGGVFGNAFGGKELPMDPSICVFWCAVALGALVKGSPIASVASYSQLAAEALAPSHSEPADAEVAKAWTILAYLYGFMGDMAKFQEYLTLSDGVLVTSIKQGSTDTLPVGFAEMIQSRENKTRRSTLESFCSRGQVPQLPRGASEAELYRYVMRSFQAFEKAMLSKMLKRSAADHEPSGGADPPPASEGGTGGQPHRHAVPTSEEVSDAMASVWVEANTVQFGPLEEAVDRPSIRAGMGGMLINGYLVFEAAGKGDVPGALIMRLDRCVEVFMRYPGLCRSIMGAHEAHTMLAALAALDDPCARQMYGTLRAAYNPFRPRGAPPAPPLEEWQGMPSICENSYCRAMGRVIASEKMAAFSTPADGAVTHEIGAEQNDESLGLARQNQRGLPAPILAPRNAVFHLTSYPSESSCKRTGCDMPCAFEACTGRSRVNIGGTEQCLGFAPAWSALTASATCLVAPDCCPSETERDADHGASSHVDGARVGKRTLDGGFSVRPDTPLVLAAGSREDAIEATDDNDVGAADWLEVTHALLDEGNEFGQDM